jgi:hypothetical protein
MEKYSNSTGFTKEELINLGINFDNMKHPGGEMNIIVQSFSLEPDEDGNFDANPDIYHPRKNSVWSCGCSGDGYDLNDEEQKIKYITHLKDSAERLKIMSLLLSRQAMELERDGKTQVNCYYPEHCDKYNNLFNK